LPERWSVGADLDQTRGQALACYRSDAIRPNSVWRLRNQPDSRFWLSASLSKFVVSPGQTVRFNGVLSGFGYAAWHTDAFRGVLRLASNDPLQPSVDLPVQASVGPPADRVVLPVITR
jgi:hypothetical protein